MGIEISNLDPSRLGPALSNARKALARANDPRAIALLAEAVHGTLEVVADAWEEHSWPVGEPAVDDGSRLTVGELPVALRAEVRSWPQQHRVLFLALARRPGELCAYEWLAEQLWVGEWPQRPQSLIRQHVTFIRSRLGAESVETVIGSGYRLNVHHLAMGGGLTRARAALTAVRHDLVRGNRHGAVTALAAGLRDALTLIALASHAGTRRRRSALIEIGGLRIDVNRAEVRWRGRPIHLVPKQFAFLVALAGSPDGLCTHADLMDALWVDEPPDHAREVISKHAGYLRTRFGDDVIVTVPSVGYRLALSAPDRALRVVARDPVAAMEILARGLRDALERVTPGPGKHEPPGTSA